MTNSREVHLIRRPSGMPTPDDFRLVSVDVPAPATGEVQVRNMLMSLDPAMRGRMTEARSYVAPYVLGEPMEGDAIGTVVSSADPGFAVGDLVKGNFGWRELFNAPAASLEKIELGGFTPEAYMHLASTSGRTAYLGMTKIAGLREGDVVFVSAAAGAVGSIAAQIAKARGHRVIGAAGGPDKTAFLREELGLDAAIDYKAVPSLTKALAQAAPEGIDIFFDNVGGEHLQAALAIANPFAHFAICGMISQYNDPGASTGPRNLTLLMGKCIRMEGFLLHRYPGAIPDFMADMKGWYDAGLIQSHTTVHDGVERAVEAFLSLLRGGNTGKMLVRLAD